MQIILSRMLSYHYDPGTPVSAALEAPCLNSDLAPAEPLACKLLHYQSVRKSWLKPILALIFVTSTI